ncbi:SAM-dependent methyltransferase [Streptomyces sp. NPDC051740]|uniref:SAM-dependent methyltransferase n=1 Tax=Streptomyces sp. NPDC051740 TaxID=3365673 RepID=UPI0037A26D59
MGTPSRPPRTDTGKAHPARVHDWLLDDQDPSASSANRGPRCRRAVSSCCRTPPTTSTPSRPAGRVTAEYARAGSRPDLRTRAEAARFFDGPDLVGPGPVTAPEWFRTVPAPPPEDSGIHAGVARLS